VPLSLIAAVANNRIIGNQNKLPWHLPADLKYFKSVTMGHHIIMGRKTFESIGGGRPLPGRTSIIITKQSGYKAEGCIVVHSLEEALNAAKHDNEPFVIGGADIFKQSLEIADKIYLTKIHHDFEGDIFFPKMEFNKWNLIVCEEHDADEKNKYPYTFLTYVRI
jgi:dihydrofolate reductase